MKDEERRMKEEGKREEDATDEEVHKKDKVPEDQGDVESIPG